MPGTPMARRGAILGNDRGGCKGGVLSKQFEPDKHYVFILRKALTPPHLSAG